MIILSAVIASIIGGEAGANHYVRSSMENVPHYPGDEVQCGDMLIKSTGWRQGFYIGDLRPKNGFLLTAVWFISRNTGKEDIEMRLNNFTLLRDEGEISKPRADATAALSDGLPDGFENEPGKTIIYGLVFDLPYLFSPSEYHCRIKVTDGHESRTIYLNRRQS